MKKTLFQSTQVVFLLLKKGGLYTKTKALSVDHYFRYIKNYKLYKLICIKSVWCLKNWQKDELGCCSIMLFVESFFSSCTWMMRISIAPRRLVHWFWWCCGHGIVICVVMFFRFGIINWSTLRFIVVNPYVRCSYRFEVGFRVHFLCPEFSRFHLFLLVLAAVVSINFSLDTVLVIREPLLDTVNGRIIVHYHRGCNALNRLRLGAWFLARNRIKPAMLPCGDWRPRLGLVSASQQVSSDQTLSLRSQSAVTRVWSACRAVGLRSHSTRPLPHHTAQSPQSWYHRGSGATRFWLSRLAARWKRPIWWQFYHWQQGSMARRDGCYWAATFGGFVYDSSWSGAGRSWGGNRAADLDRTRTFPVAGLDPSFGGSEPLLTVDSCLRRVQWGFRPNRWNLKILGLA